jgi:carbon storage regulator
MLVLSRKRNQGILIRGKDGDIRIVVLEADKGKVRLGIEAPKGYPIIREELILEIEGANKMSALKTLDKIKEFIGESSE